MDPTGKRKKSRTKKMRKETRGSRTLPCHRDVRPRGQRGDLQTGVEAKVDARPRVEGVAQAAGAWAAHVRTKAASTRADKLTAPAH